MSDFWPILETLADGDWHDPEEFPAAGRCPTGQFESCVLALEDQGLSLVRRPDGRIRLRDAIEWLSRPVIEHRLAEEGYADLPVSVAHSVDSTNQQLLEAWRGGAREPRLLLAEAQSRGRGRRGRAWVSPPGGSLYLSLLWRSPHSLQSLQGLPQAVAVGAAEALSRHVEVGIKWPNDLVVGGAKLGGVLVEVAGQEDGASWLVVGAGINYRVPAPSGEWIDQPWTDVCASAVGVPPPRSVLAGEVVVGILSTLAVLERDGFPALRHRWSAFDVLAGRRVRVSAPDGEFDGTAVGLRGDGALLIDTGRGVKPLATSEVSVRVVQ